MTPTVAIAGAGIGGLTLAIALRRRGVPVTVLERASELKPAGAGIALGPNAIVALERLGLRSAIVGAGASIGRSAILDSDGRVLGAELDVAALQREIGAPVVALQRTRLHDVLVDAAGPGVVRLGFTVLEYENLGDRIRVISTDDDRVEADLLVGADGLNSSVRAQLVSDGAPKYSGYTSWRGVTPAGAVAPPQRMTESWGRGERFGIVNIGSGEIYWFAVANAEAGGADADVREELLARFGGWHEPVAAIVRATPAARILRTDISDRDPIDCWHRGPVVLLGDAAHPMTPNLGQGAGQAIEDAVVLDQCLSAGPTIDAAVRRYEVRRVSRANRLVLASRRVGAIAQWQNAAAVWLRDTGMRLTPASVAISQARRIMQAEI
jgi:2-polyprenyl-6-methoxyphenol hydroxylase-like FAD-dependent oxidoreductase